jgi:hypothetical protein
VHTSIFGGGTFFCAFWGYYRYRWGFLVGFSANDVSGIFMLKSGLFKFVLATLRGTKNPQNGKDHRINKLKCSLPRRKTFLTFEYENVHKMINKPDPAMLRLFIYALKSQKEHPNLMRLSL